MASRSGSEGFVPVQAAGQPEEQSLGKTDDQMNQEVLALAQPLIDMGFRAELFDMVEVVKEGHSFRPFLRLVRNVVQYEQQGILKDVIAIWMKEHKLGLLSQVTMAEFTAFSRWLTSKPGRDLVCHLQRTTKLKKKAGATRTAEEVALMEVVKLMRSEYFSKLEAVRVNGEKKIAELEAKLHALRAQREQKLAMIREEFWPASLYEEPSDEELEKVCLDLYEAECRRTGKLGMDFGCVPDYVKQRYRDVARKRFMSEFAAKDEYRPIFMAYLRKNILGFQSDDDNKNEKRKRIN